MEYSSPDVAADAVWFNRTAIEVFVHSHQLSRHSGGVGRRCKIVARGRGMSMNALMLHALEAELHRVKHDEDFMTQLRARAERDREILDRLAE